MNTLHTCTASALLALGTATTSVAQVTITSNDLFAIGSRYQIGVDDSPSATPGNSGTNLSWNFGTLTAEGTRILEVMAPQDSPLGAQLGGNRAVVENTNEAADHLTVSTTQLRGHGIILGEGDLQMPLALTPPMVLLNLPAQYYQNHSGISRARLSSYLGQDIGLGFVVDSIRIRTHIAYLSEVDGWGTVTTPLGSFGAIRQFLLQNVTDSMDVYRADEDLWLLGVDVTSSAQRSWSWWAPEHDLPVVQLFDDDGNGGMDRAEWIEEDLNTTSVNGPTEQLPVQVFPNPATEQVTVVLKDAATATYILHDLNGRRVQQGTLSSEHSSIPLGELDRGVYALQVEQGRAIGSTRIVVH
jgi:hypothetical protein